jgi:hypothetical protein
MKRLVVITLAALLLFGTTLPAGAQCTTSFPSSYDNFLIGDTWCLQFCIRPPMPFVNGTFILQGLSGTGAAELPILTFGAGCNPLNTDCSEDCTPITPPTGDWVLNGYPGGYYPAWYYIGNSCIDIRIKPAHPVPDDQWTVIIDGKCSGCLCMMFEGQLPVELLNFTASAGDGEELEYGFGIQYRSL